MNNPTNEPVSDELPDPDENGIIKLEPNTEYQISVPRNQEGDDAWIRMLHRVVEDQKKEIEMLKNWKRLLKEKLEVSCEIFLNTQDYSMDEVRAWAQELGEALNAINKGETK